MMRVRGFVVVVVCSVGIFLLFLLFILERCGGGCLLFSFLRSFFFCWGGGLLCFVVVFCFFAVCLLACLLNGFLVATDLTT